MQPSEPTLLPFLQSSKTAEAIRHIDWSQHPQGPPSTWSLVFRTLLDTLLRSKFPMLLYWDKELFIFFNDAFLPSLGRDDIGLDALAKPGQQVFTGIWDTVGPIVNGVLEKGEAVWSENHLIPMERDGVLEEVYWTFSFSPVADEAATIAGVLVVCTETTDEVKHLKREEEAKNQLAFAIEAAELATWDFDPRTDTFTANERYADWFGITAEQATDNKLALNIIAEEDRQRVIEAYTGALVYGSANSYDIVYKIRPHNRPERIIRAQGKAWFGEDKVAYRFNGTLQDITELKKAESTLVYRKALLEAQNEAIPDAILIVDTKGNMLTHNRHFQELWGIPEEIIQRKDDEAALQFAMTQLVAPQEFIDRVRYCYEHPHDVTREEVHFKDGRIIERFGNPVRGEGGVNYGWAWFFRDVSEQRKTEQRIKESESYLRQVTDTVPAIIWITEPDGYCSYLNKHWYDLTGQTKEEAEGFGWLNATHPEDFESTGKLFTDANSARLPFNALYRLRTKDGSYRWAIDSGSPRFAQNGTYLGMIGTVVDVHEQKLAEEKIRQSEASIRSLVESAPFPIGVYIGREMRIELANQSIIETWGKGQDVIGKRFAEILPELDNQPIFEQLDSVYTTGIPYHARNQCVDLEIDGIIKPHYFNYSFTPLSDAASQVYGVMNTAADVTDLNVFTNKLAVSEQRFQAAVMAVEGIIWTNNAAGEMEGDQPGWSALTGQTYDEYKGYGWSAALHPDDAQPTVDEWNKAVAEQRLFQFEHRVRRADGTWGLYSVRAVPLINAESEISEWVGVHTNITPQREAEQALRESELFARSIIENSPVAQLVFIGEEMKVGVVNERMLEMLGRDEGIIGQPFMEAMPELKVTPTMERLKDVLRTGTTFYISEEQIHLVRFGKPYTGYYNYTYQALPHVDGGFYGVICTAYEVTDQVQSRKKVEEAEASLRDAVELAELGTWSIDLDKQTVIFSERLSDWLGYEPDVALPLEKIFEATKEEDYSVLQEAIATASEPGDSRAFDIEYTVVNKQTGEERILHAQGKAFFKSSGTAYKITGTTQDITAQRQAQHYLERQVEVRTAELQSLNGEYIAINEELSEANNRLMQSNRELEEFSYAASHDMQEPLRKIQTFSSFLMDHHSNQLDEKGRNFLNKIGGSVSRMKTIIDDLLRYSHQTREHQAAEPTDLNAILQNVAADLELVMEDKGATWSQDPLPEIEAVPSQMNQLFYNLFSNALKFSKPAVAPKIEVRLKEIEAEDLKRLGATDANSYIKIVFSDNGIGFQPEYAEQIFGLFKRLHAKTEYEGTGIGLGLVKKIVETHKGIIYARSKPGEGAQFHIVLPLKE